MGKRKIRILVAKVGLDGHDRGAKVIMRALQDAGIEAIYTGLRQTPEQVVSAAVQEDVDIIALSCLSGAHRTLFPKVVNQLREKNAEDIVVIGGGIIPTEDIAGMKRAGIQAIFQPETTTTEIVDYIKKDIMAGKG